MSSFNIEDLRKMSSSELSHALVKSCKDGNEANALKLVAIEALLSSGGDVDYLDKVVILLLTLVHCFIRLYIICWYACL